MEHHNSDISLDSSEVLLGGDPMFPALGIVNGNKDIVQTAFETVSQTQQPAPDLLDLSSTFSYSSSNFVLGTPSTSYNNNNNRSFHTMKPPDISSPYFSPSPVQSPNNFPRSQYTPQHQVQDITEDVFYQQDTEDVVNYGDQEFYVHNIDDLINRESEQDTDNIPGIFS